MLYNDVNNYDGVKYLVALLNIDQVETERDKFDKKIYIASTAIENIITIDRARWWGILLFKEAFHIKEKNLNNGLKASKELILFSVIKNCLIQLTFVCLLTFIVTYCKF